MQLSLQEQRAATSEHFSQCLKTSSAPVADGIDCMQLSSSGQPALQQYIALSSRLLKTEMASAADGV